MSTDLAEPKIAQGRAAHLALEGTLLVHVPTQGASDALRIAAELAKRSGARLIGVGAEAFQAAIVAGHAYPPDSLVGQWIEDLDERLRRAHTLFKAETAALGEKAIWRAETDFPDRALARYACGADWIVAVRPEHDLVPGLAPPLAELIMSTGLPVLVSPRRAAPLQARRIVVGWKDSREAARAVADAVPLLVEAERVVIVAVERERLAEIEPESLEDLRQRLKHRGCHVVVERREAGHKRVTEILAESASGHGADLIVVGAYAHSRLQEWITGGVTQDLIANCPAYVLFSR